MPDEEDTAEDERRLFGEARDRTVAFVASSLGVTRVELAGDQIGRFSLVHRGRASSVASGADTLVVGADEDVLVAAGDEFTPTGFGPATAVSVVDGRPVAAAPDGTVARLVGDDWEAVGEVVGPGRMDGDLLATGEGVYRVGDNLVHLGAANVRDVAAAGPYAATADGLLRSDDGWHRVVGGDWTLVAATDGRAHAVGEDGLYVREDDGWHAEDLPTDAPLVDLAHGESFYAVTADGTMFVHAAPEVTPDGQGGWRSRALGVPEVTGLTVL